MSRSALFRARWRVWRLPCLPKHLLFGDIVLVSLLSGRAEAMVHLKHAGLRKLHALLVVHVFHARDAMVRSGGQHGAYHPDLTDVRRLSTPGLGLHSAVGSGCVLLAYMQGRLLLLGPGLSLSQLQLQWPVCVVRRRVCRPGQCLRSSAVLRPPLALWLYQLERRRSWYGPMLRRSFSRRPGLVLGSLSLDRPTSLVRDLNERLSTCQRPVSFVENHICLSS
jgi:hypothetical protein